VPATRSTPPHAFVHRHQLKRAHLLLSSSGSKVVSDVCFIDDKGQRTEAEGRGQRIDVDILTIEPVELTSIMTLSASS
jgi:hypothetical protein